MDEGTNKKLGLLIPLIIFLALVPLFFYALFEEKEEIPSPLIGKQIPDFMLSDLSGERLLGRQDLLGEAFVLNIWGSWCPSCIHEHPFLTELQNRGVKVIGLNYKDKRRDARAFLEKLGNPYELIIFDKDGLFALDLGVYGAPENYLVDAQGRIVHKRVGMLDEKVWQEQFQERWQALSGGVD